MVLASPTAVGCLSTAPADLGHVLPVAAHRPAASPPRFPGLFRREFVCMPTFMSCAPTLAGDLALRFPVHCGKAAPSGSHFSVPFLE
jgi:hypothetical protein